MKRIKIKWINFYYAAEDGPFNDISVRLMVMLTVAVIAAHC